VNTVHTAFDVQLVSIRVGRTTMLIANIYRPPSSSKAIFSDEFAELLVLIGLHHNNRLVICDFNLPGDSQCTCDDSLTALLDTLGYQQMVTSPTRHDPATGKDNILDLLITHHPLSQQPVSNVQILDSHDLSDHSLVACELSTRRFKAPATKYSYRPIRNVDPIMFESKLRDADVFVNPAKSVDEMVRQLEEAVTGILNELAPVRVGHRPNSRKGARWLSAEAISAKRLQRKLERLWKETGSETVRVEYRHACRKANVAINASRNRHQCNRIMEAAGNPRQVWAAVKDLLHCGGRQPNNDSINNEGFYQTLATYFLNKVNNIKQSISSSLIDSNINPSQFDTSFNGYELTDLMAQCAGGKTSIIEHAVQVVTT
jgi:hypothetical protein